MQKNKSLYEKINVLEARISFISNRYVDMQKGFEFKTKENKFKIDLILQQYRETILNCELEFANYYKPFLKVTKNNEIIPTYLNIHIPPRRELYFNNNIKSFYIRIVGLVPPSEILKLNHKSLAYANIAENIINLPRHPCFNKFSQSCEELFFSDDLTTKFQGFCGYYLNCLKWISIKSDVIFLRKKGVNNRKDILKTLQFKLFDYISIQSNQEV